MRMMERSCCRSRSNIHWRWGTILWMWKKELALNIEYARRRMNRCGEKGRDGSGISAHTHSSFSQAGTRYAHMVYAIRQYNNLNSLCLDLLNQASSQNSRMGADDDDFPSRRKEDFLAGIWMCDMFFNEFVCQRWGACPESKARESGEGSTHHPAILFFVEMVPVWSRHSNWVCRYFSMTGRLEIRAANSRTTFRPAPPREVYPCIGSATSLLATDLDLTKRWR